MPQHLEDAQAFANRFDGTAYSGARISININPDPRRWDLVAQVRERGLVDEAELSETVNFFERAERGAETRISMAFAIFDGHLEEQVRSAREYLDGQVGDFYGHQQQMPNEASQILDQVVESVDHEIAMPVFRGLRNYVFDRMDASGR